MSGIHQKFYPLPKRKLKSGENRMGVNLPKIGDAISVEKFFVSKMNMRVDEEFGKSFEDMVLTEHLGKTDIVQPFIARPEGEGFGVVIGRRRFLAKRRSGAKKFVVGMDCLIREMSDEDAYDASIRENMDTFRREVNAMLRARSVKRKLDMDGIGQRELARRWRVPIANIAEWLAPLKLVQALQTLLEKEAFTFTDAVNIVQLSLDEETQNKLAKILEENGADAFKSELARVKAGREKRGSPAGKYAVARVTWNRTVPEEDEAYHRLEVLANSTDKKLEEYCKAVLIEHAMGKR